MRKSVGLATVLCAGVLALLAGAAEFSASGADGSIPPPSFRPSSAWLVLTTGTSNAPEVEGAWAVTARSNLAALAPFDFPENLRHLSRDAIYVSAMILKRRSPSTARSLEWPLRLSRFRVDHQWESQPAPNVQQRLRVVGVRGWLLDVRVYFATQHPSKRLLHEAQAQLDRLLLPHR